MTVRSLKFFLRRAREIPSDPSPLKALFGIDFDSNADPDNDADTVTLLDHRGLMLYSG